MNLPYFDLKGKVALISGGATGIGRGIAEGLAEAGCHIAVASRRVEKCEEACKQIQEKTGVKLFRIDVILTIEMRLSCLLMMCSERWATLTYL